MAVKLGLDARLYRNTGSFAVPVWNEVLKAGEADANIDPPCRLREKAPMHRVFRASTKWADQDRGIRFLLSFGFRHSLSRLLRDGIMPCDAPEHDPAGRTIGDQMRAVAREARSQDAVLVSGRGPEQSAVHQGI